MLRLLVYTVICTIVTAVSHPAVTAQKAATTRIEGRVIDSVSNKPIGCAITVIGPTKKTSIKSDSKDGSYLVVVNEAGPHSFVMAGYNVYRKEIVVNVPFSEKFQEIKRDFSLRALEEGTVVAEARGFELNAATLNAAGRKALDELMATMNSNQQMNVEITVLPDEDQLAVLIHQTQEQYKKDSLKWDKDFKAWEKKYKKKTQKPDPPIAPVPPASPTDPNIQLVSQRKEAVKQYMKDVKNGDLRLAVVTGTLPGNAVYVPPPVAPPQTGKKGKKTTTSVPTAPKPAHTSHPTLVARIGKVKRLYD